MPMADTTVVVGDTLRLQVEAVDPEGQPLAYRLVVPWMPGTQLVNAVLDSLSGAFTFIPEDTDRPLRWFGFFVRDPAGNESSISIYVAVLARSLLDTRVRVDRPPAGEAGGRAGRAVRRGPQVMPETGWQVP
jgi:hypothetical protein